MAPLFTLHHLSISQSERIVWLCEELGLDYTLQRHIRRPENKLSPDSLCNVPGNALTAAPFIEDGAVKLGETPAIAEYILLKYGNGKLMLPPDHKDFDRYLYFFHLANGNLMPSFGLKMQRNRVGIGEDSRVGQFYQGRFERLLRHVSERLADNKWLAGEEFTAADCMNAYIFSTHRMFVPTDLTDYPNIVRWLGDCAQREGYKRFWKKAEPDMDPVISAKGPEKSLLG